MIKLLNRILFVLAGFAFTASLSMAADQIDPERVFHVDFKGQILKIKDLECAYDLVEECMAARNSGYPLGSVMVDAGMLVGTHKISLIRDNVIEIKNKFIWFKGGELLFLTSPGYVNWTLPDGTKLIMDCRDRIHKKLARLVAFHPNGEYKSGCNSMSQAKFNGDNYFADVRYSSSIWLWPNGGLKYASRISADSQVTVLGQTVGVTDMGEISIYENGQVEFFTVKAGDVLDVEVPIFGNLKFGTDSSQPISAQFTEDGKIVAGGLVEPLETQLVGHDLELNVEAARLYDSGHLGLMILKPNEILPSEIMEKAIVLRDNRIAVCLNIQGQPIMAKYCRKAF